MICCDKFMEVKGICADPMNGWGGTNYSICLQCNKCGKIKITNKKR